MFVFVIFVVCCFYVGRFSIVHNNSCVTVYDTKSFSDQFLHANYTTTEEISVNYTDIPVTESMQMLSHKLKCFERDNSFQIERRGAFWALKNYIPARVRPKCHESITYTTHGDYSFLDNVIPLMKRWIAPLSLAIYCPGDDYETALQSVVYLRKCTPESDLVKDFVTFHFFFDRTHTPKEIIKDIGTYENTFECGDKPPFEDIPSTDKYKTKQNLTYPINVGRNIARDAAPTHFVLPSDIELYPNPGLVTDFLRMYSKFDTRTNLKEVFVLPIFEVKSTESPPVDKKTLQEMLKTGAAVPFHYKICANCHSVPGQKEWIDAETKPGEMSIHATSKRQDKFVHWEPIYICTHNEPSYEEMLSWEGKSDKMTQGYVLCVLDYDFHVLSEGFLVHRPGIKTLSEARRPTLEAKSLSLLKTQIVPQIESLYGTRKGCKP